MLGACYCFRGYARSRYEFCSMKLLCLLQTHTMVLKEFPGNPVLPKKLFHVEKKNVSCIPKLCKSLR